MSNNYHDPLRQLTEVIANQPIPEGPTSEVKQQLLDKLPQPVTTPSPFLRRQKTMRKILSVAAIVLVVFGFASLNSNNRVNSGSAFAAMLAQVKQVRTATFDVAVKMNGAPEVKAQVSLLEPSWMRQEIAVEDKLAAVHIMNQEDGKMLLLEIENKKATLLDMHDMPENPQQQSIIESFRKLPEDAGVFKGEETVGDVAALKYAYDLSGMNYEVWVDAESKMPIKITMADHVDAEKAKIHIMMSNFEWGAQVDASLFSLDLPEGYSLQKQAIDLSKGAEHDFINLMKIYARLNDGNFSDEWNAMTPATMGTLFTLAEGTQEEKKEYAFKKMADALEKTGVKDMDEKQKEALSTELQQTVIRGAVYFSKILETHDWHYQGKGVKLGEAEKTVAWWFPKKDKAEEGTDLNTAHVLYGDLRIEKMPVDQVPQSDAE